MSQGPPEVPSELGLTRPHGSRKRPRTPSQTHRLTHQLLAVTLSWLHVEFASYEERGFETRELIIPLVPFIYLPMLYPIQEFLILFISPCDLGGDVGFPSFIPQPSWSGYQMEGHTSSMKMTRYDHVTINAYRSVIIMYLIVSIKLVRLSTLHGADVSFRPCGL